MDVMIDGVAYVPRAEIPALDDHRLKKALHHLTAIQYFDEKHKNRAMAWDALHALAPELAQLAAINPEAAYDRMRPDDTDDTE